MCRAAPYPRCPKESQKALEAARKEVDDALDAFRDAPTETDARRIGRRINTARMALAEAEHSWLLTDAGLKELADQRDRLALDGRKQDAAHVGLRINRLTEERAAARRMGREVELTRKGQHGSYPTEWDVVQARTRYDQLDEESMMVDFDNTMHSSELTDAEIEAMVAGMDDNPTTASVALPVQQARRDLDRMIEERERGLAYSHNIRASLTTPIAESITDAMFRIGIGRYGQDFEDFNVLETPGRPNTRTDGAVITDLTPARAKSTQAALNRAGLDAEIIAPLTDDGPIHIQVYRAPKSVHDAVSAFIAAANT